MKPQKLSNASPAPTIKTPNTTRIMESVYPTFFFRIMMFTFILKFNLISEPSVLSSDGSFFLCRAHPDCPGFDSSESVSFVHYYDNIITTFIPTVRT